MNAMPDMHAAMAQALVPQPKPVTHDVKILRTRKVARAKVVPVSPEEFGISRNTRTIPDSNYCFHRIPTHTEGSLIAQGYDAEQVKKLPTYSFSNNTEQLARDSVDEEMWATGDNSNRAARPVEVIEHYVWMDYEDNDKPCLYKVTTGSTGDVLSKNGEPDVEEFDAMPFASATPIPIPHRFFGRSIADLVMPAQREKTALKRGALDNLYLHNNPRVEVAEQNAGLDTLDDLLVSRPGGVVRTKTPGGLNWQVTPDISGSVYPMMQYIDAELESRTGMSRQSQGIDANALQNQSATAVAQVFSASQLRVKLFARAMAEGVRDIFSLLHATIRKHGQEAQTVRLRNSWTQVDPRQWKTREDMTIHVGLGTGGKAQQFAQIMALANFQKELLLGGKAHLVGDRELYNTGAELIKVMGHKNPDKFLNDPSAKDPQTGQLLHPPISPQPDPKLLAVQAKGQNDMAIAQQKAAHEQQKMQADAIHQQIKLQAEVEFEKIKADLDGKLKIIDAHVKTVLAEQKMRHDQQAHHLDAASTVVDVVATAHKHDMQMEHDAATHEAKLQQMRNTPTPKAGK